MTETTATPLETLRHRAVAGLPRIVDGLAVEAYAFQGGIGRGLVDHLSDVDLVLAFGRKSDSVGAPKGELDPDGLNWSVFHVHLDSVAPERWPDKVRYVYVYETSILWDPAGRLAGLCERAHLARDEQIDRVTYLVKKLGNGGVTYRGAAGTVWRGMKWDDKPDLWLQRGDPYAAHMRLDQVHSRLTDLAYAVNQLPIPSSKWRDHLVAHLPIVPGGFGSGLRDLAVTRDFGRPEFERRLELAVGLLTDLVDLAVERELLPVDIAAHYVPRFSQHSDDTDQSRAGAAVGPPGRKRR